MRLLNLLTMTDYFIQNDSFKWLVYVRMFAKQTIFRVKHQFFLQHFDIS